jgi:hypothetical protein
MAHPKAVHIGENTMLEVLFHFVGGGLAMAGLKSTGLDGRKRSQQNDCAGP